MAVDWLARSFVPTELSRCEADQCLVLLDEDLPEDLSSRTKRIPGSYGEGPTKRLTLLWFTMGPPDSGWTDRFARHPDAVAETGLLRSLFVSPFIPILMGSDEHIDRLR